MPTGTIEKKSKQQVETNLAMLFSEIEYGETELTAENIPEAWFQVIKTGTFYDFRYGQFKVDNQLLNELKKNFEDNILEVDIALDKGHMWGDGAFAWVGALQVKGNALWAQFKDFTDDGMTALLSKKFKYFSIEFGAFEKPCKEEKGKLEKYANVLRGIAMTNRPVIKGMKDRPSFFSDSIYSLINNPNNMEVFKKILSELSAKAKVNPAEFALLKTAMTSLSDDEQAEVKEDVAKVEEKVEEPKTEPAKPADAEADKDLSEYADKESCMADMLKKGKDKAVAEAMCKNVGTKKQSELSEIVSKQGLELAESRKKIQTLEADKAARVLSERMGELMLSETNSNGFAIGVKSQLETLVSKFSDAEYSDFKALLAGYKTINTAVLGDSVKPEGDLQAAFDKAVDEHMKANKSTYSDAMVAVRAARPEFKKLV